MYNSLNNFDYPHKDKLLEFIKYFFLDHIESESVIMLNYQALMDHLQGKRGAAGLSPSSKRNESNLRSRRKSTDSGISDELTKRKQDD